MMENMEDENNVVETTLSTARELEPEQLGSVTHNQDTEGSSTGLLIRSSARVSKKMRLDNQIQSVDIIPVTPVTPVVVPVIEKKETVTREGEDGKPRRRNWELWSTDDKDTFFEALNELGKDFDAIQNYFKMKGQKKSISDHLIKNKDQIRHFYYRTWHKVCKHLTFSNDVKKATQELYALVNYGELRRKLGGVTQKTSVKLSELVHKGYTQVKSKGKTMRIRTPPCRILRKLNQLDDCQEVLKLPTKISIELKPRTNHAWGRVQATAHNPRVRTQVPLQKRLSSVISYLSHTWSSDQQKLRDKVASNFSPLVPPTLPTDTLHLAPRPNAVINLPTINLNDYLNSNSLSLNSYEERVSLHHLTPEARGKQKNTKTSNKKQRSVDLDDNNACDKSLEDLMVRTNDATEQLGEKNEENEDIIRKIRQGWTLLDANAVTIGELYLMFGNESTLQLDYWWEEEMPTSYISYTLKALLSLGKLYARKSRVHCPCGHICGGLAKPRAAVGLRAIRAAGAIHQDADSAKDDGVFVRPQAPGSIDAFKAQLDNFRPRYCNRRGRTLRAKNVVAQRMLPLLPKLPSNTQVTSVQIVPMMTLVESPVVTPQPRQTLNLGVEDITLSSASNFAGLLTSEEEMQTPPTSPSRILKEGDSHWLNSEVADFSLSSFLGHLDSPLKTDTPELDPQLQCLEMGGEVSVDYMAQFADLAAQIVSSDLQNKK